MSAEVSTVTSVLSGGGVGGSNMIGMGLSARRADAASDPRIVVVPAILGASVACAWVGGVAALAKSTGDVDGSLHSLFLGGVAAWSLSTASLGPALPAYAADLAPERHRGLSTALFRSCGDAGFVLAPVGLGAFADCGSPPLAMGALAFGAASTGLTFAALGTPHPPISSLNTNMHNTKSELPLKREK